MYCSLSYVQIYIIDSHRLRTGQTIILHETQNKQTTTKYIISFGYADSRARHRSMKNRREKRIKETRERVRERETENENDCYVTSYCLHENFMHFVSSGSHSPLLLAGEIKIARQQQHSRNGKCHWKLTNKQTEKKHRKYKYIEIGRAAKNLNETITERSKKKKKRNIRQTNEHIKFHISLHIGKLTTSVRA